jgi:hypothetical protein
MPWARFADDYLGNSKLTGLSTVAIALDVTSIIYSARDLRDGHLTQSDVQVIATLIHLRRWAPVVGELVHARRWAPTSVGWDIHDYLEYQPSREAVLRQRDEDRVRKRRGAQTTNGHRLPAGSGPDSENNPGAPGPGPGVNSRPPARLAGRSAPAGAREPADFQPLGDLLAADLPDEVLERLGRPPIGQPAKAASPSIPSQETPGAVG